MWGWIKKHFDYRNKYHALLNERNEAIKQAIDIMGRYDFLCASLPKGHELSTERNWQAFANNRLRSENFNLTKKLEAITEAHNSMTYLWQENLYKYGVEMYGKWQPMELAPKDGTEILSVVKGEAVIVWWREEGQEWCWQNNTLSVLQEPSHWMPLPKSPLMGKAANE